MKIVKHPNVVTMIDCFFSKGSKSKDVYLNIVMEDIPETVYQTIRRHARASQCIPYPHIKRYAYQICRAVAYVHSLGICHRDIKPQNLLLDPTTHVVKLCDFGSAKILQKGYPNVAYICSRYYRAPELMLESSNYTCAVDIWSVGCVAAELFLGTTLFQGGSVADQFIEIIKVLGLPTRKDVHAMNPAYRKCTFPPTVPIPLKQVFRRVKYRNQRVPSTLVNLIDQMLVYQPENRIDLFEALGHPFLKSLCKYKARLPNYKPLPELLNFSGNELAAIAMKPVLAKAFKNRIKISKPTYFRNLDSERTEMATQSVSKSSQNYKNKKHFCSFEQLSWKGRVSERLHYNWTAEFHQNIGIVV